MISAIELALSLLSMVLAAAKKGGVATDVIADIEAAIEAVQKVRGTPVTFGQLEGLRVTPKW